MLSTLYALGSNGSGQLGLGHCDDVNKPTACLFKIKLAPGRIPSSISAGGNHTLVHCNDGSVYAAGDNSDGRCGIILPPSSKATMVAKDSNKIDSTLCTTFRRVAFPCASVDDAENPEYTITTFKFTSATWSASFFATPTAIYGAGAGLKGELGLGPDIPCTTAKSPYPIQIPDFPPPDTTIFHLTSGVHHTLAVLSTGEVYGWGTARHGELGEPRVPFVTRPRKIGEVGFAACKAVAGLGWSYIFSAAVGESAGNHGEFKHILLGSEKHGLQSSLPPAQTLCTYDMVTASWSSIYVLLRPGEIMSWGRSSNDKDPSAPPPGLPPTVTLIGGSEHILARGAEDGEVRAWGWGEHGNCGEGWGDEKNITKSDGDQGDVASKEENDIRRSEAPWNVLPVSTEQPNATSQKYFMPIGAGCATSWLLLIDNSEP